MRAIAEEPVLPAAMDIRTIIPPTVHAYARRMGVLNLWLFYQERPPDTVRFITITKAPPTPVD
jgi:hypothetical protein